MTTETTEATASDPSVGATTDRPLTWHQINWRRAERTVRRLQTRIAQAPLAGKWGKVKALQRLLTHSLSGKALAVRRVTENTGKRTPGGDGETWKTPEQKTAAMYSLHQRGYHPRPLRRVYIPKSNGAQRPLSIPTMQDRAMQALYLLALDPVAETMAEPNSYGFRLERSTADAIDQCHRVLSQRASAQWIFEGDIRACFDSLSHDWLVAHIPLDTAILRKWLQAGFMDQHLFSPTETGVPQGGVMSPVIMNLALTGLERHITGALPTFQGTHRTKVHVIRFADDFIITGSSKDFLEQEVQPLVEQFLAARGLALAREKTRVTPIEEGFDFLGTCVRKYHGKLLCTPAKKNVRSFL